MATINVLNAAGKKVRDYTFTEGFFPETPNTHLMYLHVVRQLTNGRAGTASALTRAEVRGGGKKPWKQKGTGRARAGSIRSPLWKGGGVIFGPKPRTFHKAMPVKARRGAIRSALLAKLDVLTSVESFGLDKPSTKTLAGLLADTLKVSGKVLIIASGDAANLALSARNLRDVKLVTARDLSVKDIVGADAIVACEAALKEIEEVYQA